MSLLYELFTSFLRALEFPIGADGCLSLRGRPIYECAGTKRSEWLLDSDIKLESAHKLESTR